MRSLTAHGIVGQVGSRPRSLSDAAPRTSDVEGSWLPVAVGWDDFRPKLVHELQRGFATVGIETRIEELGEPPMTLSMLRVRCPVRAMEAAETWLLRLVAPLDAQDVKWASDVDCLLHQRWPVRPIWTGSPKKWHALKPRLKFAEPSQVAFVGARYMTWYLPKSVVLEVFPRSAGEVLARMPRVEIQPDQDLGNPQEWFACAAQMTSASGALREFQDALTSRGIRTCRYEIASSTPPQSLLAIHTGADDVEQLVARIAAVRPQSTPLEQWEQLIPLPQIVVHRCRSSVTLALFNRMMAELPEARLGCGFHPEREELGQISASLPHVDRVLGWLRMHKNTPD